MIACFGEIMLRLSPEPDSYLLEQASELKITPGGSESNVAIALSGLGNKTTLLTLLPDNILGSKVVRYLKWHNVDTSRICFHKTARMGLYFTEKGSGIRGYRVLYDRENSAYNHVKDYSGRIDRWLSGCSWLHLSGISLAVSREAADFTLNLTQQAQKKGLKISFDVNHRQSLWKWCRNTAERCRYLNEIVSRCTVLVGNETDLEEGLLGLPGLTQQKALNKIAQIADKKLLKWVAISQRKYQTSDVNTFGGILYDFTKNFKKPDRYSVREKAVTEIIDRLGTGDAFCGGIIDGYIKNLSCRTTLKNAVTLGILKHGISGDACIFDAALLQKAIVDDKGKIIR